MDNVKFKFGYFSELENGSISFEHDSITGTVPYIKNIYIDMNLSEQGLTRLSFIPDQLIEPANGDVLILSDGSIYGCTTRGNVNFQIGGEDDNILNGSQSFAFGRGLRSSYSKQILLGEHNANNQDSIIEIGNGTSNSNRSNLLRITNKGHVELTPQARNGTNTLNITINDSGLKLYDGNADALLTPSGFQFKGAIYSGNGIEFESRSKDITIQGPEFLDLNITVPMGSAGWIDPLIRLHSSTGPEELSHITIQADELTFIAKGVNDNSTPKMEVGVDLPTSQYSSKVYFEKEKISLTGQTIQFNCDINNIVDKNNNPLFEKTETKITASTVTALDEKNNQATLYYNYQKNGLVIAKITLPLGSSVERKIKIPVTKQLPLSENTLVATILQHTNNKAAYLTQPNNNTIEIEEIGGKSYYSITVKFGGTVNSLSPTFALMWMASQD